MAIFNLNYIIEYTNSYDDDDEEDQEKDLIHLTRDEIRRVMIAVTSALIEFPQLKKCCDYINIDDRDHIDNNGIRASSYMDYESGRPKAFIELIDGDVFSGYPNFKSGGNADYEKDERSFVSKVNETLAEKNIKAKFMVGPDKDDEAISFGVKSTKEKLKK